MCCRQKDIVKLKADRRFWAEILITDVSHPASKFWSTYSTSNYKSIMVKRWTGTQQNSTYILPMMVLRHPKLKIHAEFLFQQLFIVNVAIVSKHIDEAFIWRWSYFVLYLTKIFIAGYFRNLIGSIFDIHSKPWHNMAVKKHYFILSGFSSSWPFPFVSLH